MPNISSIISSHNKKILNKDQPPSPTNPPVQRTCNCRSHAICPLNGKCLEEATIYKATVTTDEKVATYVGSTELPFKTRYTGHKSSFLHQHQAKSTTLSKYIWDLKMQGTDYELKWEVLKQCSPYRCGARVCDLCLTEKLIILQASEESTLNKHSEIMQKCRHRNKFKVKSVIQVSSFHSLCL